MSKPDIRIAESQGSDGKPQSNKRKGRAPLEPDSDDDTMVPVLKRKTAKDATAPASKKASAPPSRAASEKPTERPKATQTRGKKAALFIESDSDEEPQVAQPSRTAHHDEDDSDEEQRRPTRKAAAASRRKPVVDDDSDDELAFKGFGNRRKR